MWLQVPRQHHDDELNRKTGDGIIEDSNVLEVFQVYKAPRAYGAPVFVSTIMEHTFGFSYGRPFVGTYRPAPVNFTHVQFTLSTTSAGRQFDRLALVFLGDHELWRSSTAEPTQSGIHFQYTKDMTRFLSLLQSEQPFVFEMGNLVDETYTGKFAMTLTAQFYFAPEQVGNGSVADTIIPVSACRSAQREPSHFSLPQDRAAVTLTLPRTAHKATMLISASGNAAEEFWYANVASEFKHVFPDVSLDGYGPHRELQVHVNGKLFAATFPFPVIFTGGIAPGLWRPIVGISAYDLPMYEVDLTPVLPLLWDGADVEIKVESGDLKDNAIGRDWIVSGNIFVWTGTAEGEGEVVEHTVRSLDITTIGALSTDRTNLNVTSVATRQGLVRSILRFGDNGQQEVFSRFDIKSRNAQIYTKSGQRQRVLAEISGTENSTALGDHEYHYPLGVDSLYEFSPVFKISAEISRGMVVDRKKSGLSLWTHQAGHAYYIGPDGQGNGPYGGGATEQGYIESTGSDQYWRTVRAVNGKVVRDLEAYDGNQLVDDMAAEERLQGNQAGVQAAEDNLVFFDCLQAYNEHVFSAKEHIEPQDDVEVKKCIKRMLGRGPAL
ncbi:peptide N-acetyl-beta-D-glucosaminyl asparaginase amidase A-domain-containing protein [Lipomyces kononenkoae]|uniref:Peptide N-acetyl-beta-D-glucosaminyl asparaginase amidase A-domain-containing protein n=1 Tax=Lipomyces kononenkoae TaxID=34357 RepID=A0ACC3SVK6_LIPKO